jgi:hypothetical protein
MNKRQQYMILAGIGILIMILLVLLISPSSLLSPTITAVGTNLNKSTSDQISVITKTDFDPEQIKNFPYDIGKWHGQDYDATQVAKQLGANYLLVRGYDPETFTQPLFFTILQSKTDSSFHAPDYCFPYQGYLIQEEAKDNLVITNQAWSKGQSNIALPLNKLVVTKNSTDNKIIERRVVLYFYLKGNQFYSDTITMIEVQGLTPLQGSYDGTLNEEKEFLSQAVPLLFQFQPASDSQWHPLIATMAEKGISGYIGIAIIFIIPLSIIFYPIIRRRGLSR